MDPDKVLEDIRKLLEKYPWEESDIAVSENFNSLQEKIRCLDQFLSKGGFLPTDWNVAWVKR